MANKFMRYHAYIIRLWPETANGRIVWRCSLEDVQTRQRRGFDSLPTLFAFLEGSVRVSTQGDSNGET